MKKLIVVLMMVVVMTGNVVGQPTVTSDTTVVSDTASKAQVGGSIIDGDITNAPSAEAMVGDVRTGNSTSGATVFVLNENGELVQMTFEAAKQLVMPGGMYPPTLPFNGYDAEGSGNTLSRRAKLHQRRWDPSSPEDLLTLKSAFPKAGPVENLLALIFDGDSRRAHRHLGVIVTNDVENKKRTKLDHDNSKYKPLDVLEMDLQGLYDERALVWALRKFVEEVGKKGYVFVGEVAAQGATGKSNTIDDQIVKACVIELLPLDVHLGLYYPTNGVDRHSKASYFPGISIATANEDFGVNAQAGINDGKSTTLSRPDGYMLCFRYDPEEVQRRNKIEPVLLSLWEDAFRTPLSQPISLSPASRGEVELSKAEEEDPEIQEGLDVGTGIVEERDDPKAAKLRQRLTAHRQMEQSASNMLR
jgi:hypothetical protein